LETSHSPCALCVCFVPSVRTSYYECTLNAHVVLTADTFAHSTRWYARVHTKCTHCVKSVHKVHTKCVKYAHRVLNGRLNSKKQSNRPTLCVLCVPVHTFCIFDVHRVHTVCTLSVFFGMVCSTTYCEHTDFKCDYLCTLVHTVCTVRTMCTLLHIEHTLALYKLVHSVFTHFLPVSAHDRAPLV